MADRIKVEGLPGLKAALALRAAALQAAAEGSVALETKAVRADAESKAPRDTGELAGSITDSVRDLEGTVETNNRHAGFNEFGTSKMPARPFMEPAAAASRLRFVGRTAAAVKRAVS